MNENKLFYFNDDGSKIIINETKENRTPLAWSNIMANESFGTVVTTGMGGFTWVKNAQSNKITKFSNDPYMDKSSEYFLVTECDTFKSNIQSKKGAKDIENNNYTNANIGHKRAKIKENIYSLDVNNLPDDNNYKTTFGFGYSVFEHETKNIKTKLAVLVPISEENKNVAEKISIIKVINKLSKKQNIKIKYVIDFQDKIDEEYNENSNSFFITETNNNCYIYCNEKINENKEIELNLKPKEEKEICIILKSDIINKDNEKVDSENNNKTQKFIEEIELTKNFQNNKIDAEKLLKDCKEKLSKTKKYWNELVKKCTCKTPDNNFDIMQNGWLCYQTIASRLYAKTGFYQVSGAYGFRDQLQASTNMKWVDENILRNQIIINANHQFLEGDVMHWWHEDKKIGIRTRYTDDLLFLPLAVSEYINFTGDYSILDEKADYIIENELKENEKDKVINFEDNILKCNNLDFSILEHCIKAINRVCKFGKYNLPLMQGGDWNDGMNKIGINGRGESVWLGFFLYYVLNNFSEILKEYCAYIDNYSNNESNQQKDKINNKIEEGQIQNKKINKNKKDINKKDNEIETRKQDSDMRKEIKYLHNKINEYENIKEKLKEVLNEKCWDGSWFIRAIDDNGNFVGSKNSEECKIDNEVQAWSVISGAGEIDKAKIAMNNLEKLLVDNDHNLVKLLAPPLEKVDLGYISSYPKGIRENGGQYSHAVIWDAIAFCMLGENDKDYEFLKKVNPIEHTNTKEKLEMYKVEPYVIAADIYSEGNLAGHGGWTWYTGTAGWMYELQTKYILGLNIHHKIITINPHVPSNWNEYKIIFKYKNAIYNFKMKRKSSNKQIINYRNFKADLKEKGKYDFEIEY